MSGCDFGESDPVQMKIRALLGSDGVTYEAQLLLIAALGVQKGLIGLDDADVILAVGRAIPQDEPTTPAGG